MMNENNPSINLYAQLAVVAKIRTKTHGPRLSAGAGPATKTQGPYEKTCVFFPRILEFTYEPRHEFKNQLSS